MPKARWSTSASAELPGRVPLHVRDRELADVRGALPVAQPEKSLALTHGAPLSDAPVPLSLAPPALLALPPLPVEPADPDAVPVVPVEAACWHPTSAFAMSAEAMSNASHGAVVDLGCQGNPRASPRALVWLPRGRNCL
jgi:hypothetical protein